MKIKMWDLSLLDLANECIKEHKRLYSDHDSEWGKGDAAEIKRYPDRSVSIRYENGQWFHYLEVSGESALQNNQFHYI